MPTKHETNNIKSTCKETNGIQCVPSENYIPLAHVGACIGARLESVMVCIETVRVLVGSTVVYVGSTTLGIGSTSVCNRSAMLFGYQHLGIGNANCLCLGVAQAK